MVSLEQLKSLVVPQIAPCLSASLYFRSGESATEHAIVACFEDYCRCFRGHLQWFAEDDTGRFRAFDDEALEYPRTRLSAPPGRRAAARSVHWTAYGGEHHRDASPWRFYAAVRREQWDSNDLSALQASCAIDAFEPGFERFRDLVVAWANSAPAVHGYGGLSLNVSTVAAVAQNYKGAVLSLARRFQGFEIEDTSATSMSALDGIKGVNWLTVVSNELLAGAGGLAALRLILSPEIVTFSVRDGVLFQAGLYPEVGDVNRGERLPYYRELSRALRAIRATKHWPYGQELFGAGVEKTDEWLRRLDD